MMMRWHKPHLLAVLFLPLMSLMLIGCTLTATPTPQVLAVVTEEVGEASEAVPTATDTPTATPELQIVVLPGNSEQATLTAQDGRVEVRRATESAYMALLKNQSVLVSAGDVIRTDTDGTALLVFLNNTETTLFPNTVLAIDSFTRSSSGAYDIKLMQFIGTTFNRVNFTNPNSREQVTTPYGVAFTHSTGYWVEVTISGPIAATLLTQELEALAAQVGQAIVSGDLSALFQVIMTFLGATPGTVSVDVGAGTVSFIDNRGNVVTITSGMTANSGTNSSGNTITVTTTVIDRYCGDGICDPYLGETARNCRADC